VEFSKAFRPSIHNCASEDRKKDGENMEEEMKEKCRGEKEDMERKKQKK
jgi:hypothetical protein